MDKSAHSLKIGFIGAGVMGRPMAENLMSAGYPLNIHSRSREKAAHLVEAGAGWKESPAELASSSDIIITIVGFPEDVEEVYFGGNGIFKGLKPGSRVIDMTTSSPGLARKIYERASALGADAIDAPVSGGDRGAREASLSVMAGGNRTVFESLLPVLEAVGSNIVYQGPAGSGQHAKMANQIAIASNMLGVCEAIAYAEKSGLNPGNVMKSIERGAAGSWSLSNLAPRMLDGDFEPGFYVKHFIKDLKIALQEAGKLGLELPGLRLAEKMYAKLASEGGEGLGTQALLKLYGSRS